MGESNPFETYHSNHQDCLIIGEVAQSHDGSLGTAHAFIDAIANAGADAVKFQTHIASAESTLGEPWRGKFRPQDTSRYDYWKRMEFTEEQWHGLEKHAEEQNLLFLSSPFSIEAADLLTSVGVAAWKIASGEVSNTPMLERMVRTKLPILLSSGMSPLSELDVVISAIKSYQIPLTILHCTSAYPCPPEKIGLNMLPIFRESYKCSVWLSDHSGTIYPGIAAVSLRCQVLEIHVILSHEMFCPDVPASITTSELCQLVEGIRFIERILSNPVDKDQLAQEMIPLRDLFTKSIVARIDLPAGTILEENHLTGKKPGTGIPASRLPEALGRCLSRNIFADELVFEEDLSP